MTALVLLTTTLWDCISIAAAGLISPKSAAWSDCYHFYCFPVRGAIDHPEPHDHPVSIPVARSGLLLATLFNLETGLIFGLVISVLAAYGLPNTLDLMPYYMLASLTGVLVLGSARRFWVFFRAGIAIALAGIAMILAFRLPFNQMDWVGIVTLSGAAVFNGLASASITLLLQYFLAQVLGLTTPLQLLEISRPDFPLLQFFLRNAPGTYQHSLQVANLAEQAAENIGADALLTRVGALFHDIGKAINPSFFIENQAHGSLNTHDDLDPRIAPPPLPSTYWMASSWRANIACLAALTISSSSIMAPCSPVTSTPKPSRPRAVTNPR